MTANGDDVLTVWVASSGEYEQWGNWFVAASLDAAVAEVKRIFGPPYVVTWEDVQAPATPEDDTAYLTGHWEAVPGKSTKHSDTFDFRRFTVVSGRRPVTTPRACAVCGHDPACGYASVYHDGREDWYCHGDCSHEEDSGVSCYERASLSAMQSETLR